MEAKGELKKGEGEKRTGMGREEKDRERAGMGREEVKGRKNVKQDRSPVKLPKTASFTKFSTLGLLYKPLNEARKYWPMVYYCMPNFIVIGIYYYI